MVMDPRVASQLDVLKKRQLALAIANVNPNKTPDSGVQLVSAPAPVPASVNAPPPPSSFNMDAAVSDFLKGTPQGTIITAAGRDSLFNRDLQSRQFEQDKLNNDRNFRINESAVTGNYLSPDQQVIADRMATLKRANVNSTGADQQKIWDESNNLRNQWNMKGYDPNAIASGITADEMLKRIGAGSRTQQAKAQDLNNMQTIASLTGRLPNGQPTTSEQQRQLGNQWMLAEQTGVIPNELADMYGLPKGTPTLAAKHFAQSLAIQQQNADTSSLNATTRTDKTLNPTGTASQYYKTIMDQFSDPIYQKDATGNVAENGQGNPIVNGHKLTTDPAKRGVMIDQVIGLGLSEAETDRMFALLGVPQGEVNKRLGNQ